MKCLMPAILAIAFAMPAFAQDGTISDAEMKEAQEAIASPEVQEMIKKIKPAGANMGMLDPAVMKAMTEMNNCMQKNVSNDARMRMAKEGDEFAKQVKTFCKAGKRDEAEQLQKDYAVRVSKSEDFKAMQACSQKHKDMMKHPAFANMNKQMQQAEATEKHICDVKKAG